jgi:hypothetical protein
MEEELVQYLLADSALSALVDNRMTWNVRPQGSQIPSITLQVISDIRDYAINSETFLHTSRVQIDCWCDTYIQSLEVSRAVTSSLSGLKEDLSGVEIQGAFLIDQRQSYDESDATARYHRVSLDFNIWYRKVE